MGAPAIWLSASGQNDGQLLGWGWSIRRAAPTGAKYVTTFVAGAALSLRAMCACSPLSRYPCPCFRLGQHRRRDLPHCSAGHWGRSGGCFLVRFRNNRCAAG